jgi:predicted alpha/beta hydrolase family esterase
MNGGHCSATVLLIPGLREHVSNHWQTLLAARLPGARTVPPGGRENLDCAARIEAIEREAGALAGPLIVVAHSAGVIATVHWLRRTRRSVQGALLATPPDFERPLPEGYPTITALREGGWLPVPRARLPCQSIVAASGNDPLGPFNRVAALAACWGSWLVDLGDVGHLNPGSGFGEWPAALRFIEDLAPGRSGAAAVASGLRAGEAIR